MGCAAICIERRLVGILLACVIVFASSTIRVTARSVNVGLHAAWSHTSSAAEATAWVAHNVGDHAVLPFLKTIAAEVRKEVETNTGVEGFVITQRREHELVERAFLQQLSSSLVWDTLSWVLQARQYTPFVYLHYSIANDTLSAFAESSRGIERHEAFDVFAVKIDSLNSRGTLVSQASELERCDHCAVVESPLEEDHLSFALGLPRDISISEACNFNDSTPSTFLYAHLLSQELDSWIEHIESQAAKCDQKFVLRFWDVAFSDLTRVDDRPGLQGFVVQADLKSTEYKVIDDRVFSNRLFDDCPFGETECTQRGNGSDEGLTSIADDDSNAKPSTYTGAQALQYLALESQGDPIKALTGLKAFTEDKPYVVRTEEFMKIDAPNGEDGKSLRKALNSFREKVGEDDYLFINGRSFGIEELMRGTEKLFQCLSITTVSSMHIDLAAKELGSGLDMSKLTKRLGSYDKRRLRVDLKMTDSLGSALVWFNNLQKDSRYKKWKTLDVWNKTSFAAYHNSIQKEEKSTKTGNPNFASFKAHHLSLVVLVDPGDANQFAYSSIPETIVRSDMPIRVGIVMVPNGRVSALIAASFHYLLKEKGRRTCARFLQMIRQVLQYFGGGFQQVPMSEQVIELAFSQISSEANVKYASAADVLENDEEIKEVLRTAQSFAEKHQLYSEVDQGNEKSSEEAEKKFSMLGILNGIVLKDISADIIPVAMGEQRRIGEFLRYLSDNEAPEISEDASDFHTWVASDPNLIVVEGLSRDMRSGDRRMSRFRSKDDVVRLSSKTVLALRKELRNLEYVSFSKDQGSDGDYSMTVWLAAKDHGSALFAAAASYLEKLGSSEFAKRTSCRFAVLQQKSALHGKIIAAAANVASDSDVLFVINGRVLAVSELSALSSLEVEIGSEYEESEGKSVSPDLKLFQSMFNKDMDTACEVDPLGSSRGPGQVMYQTVVEALDASNMSALTFRTNVVSEDEDSMPLSVLAVVNPLEERAFMAASLLWALQEAYGNDRASITFVLSPTGDQLKKHFDAPATYARFLIGSKTNFLNTAERRIPERARFDRLAERNVFTIAVEPPRAWFVSSFATNYDMDNVVLTSLPKGVLELNAEYELTNLIVEGSCIDESDSPPQGLKLVLSNEGGIMVDTLVMANLGYFQLKVPAPGRWSLQLAPGPSSKIFSMKTMEMYSGQIKTVYRADSKGRLPILVESLGGAGGILLRVERKPGMERLSVLDPDSTSEPKREDGIASRIKARLSKLYSWQGEGRVSQSGSLASKPTSDTIHVFSVASGHLYERFLKIMMSSVTKHASRPVKFWLLENYLSPSFKKFLPIFAKKLGCEVGMVTYKWPGWLRAQTEKQRIIWAYKILFLDVLFPLDVGRIIFVDSDQVLRGDLAELMDIDLKGAPYGYVPFCDSRKEVEGYRFWKQGFWKETLGEQKYRISALYVVDLNRFRETSAGDTLRFIYQSLSADPNSLSNLDQDLPNYASVSSVGGGQSVPIFDLPAEWLWCESWCDDESKKTAKAIDLCNNPMTKEPKLVSAKRIIAEWTEYDDKASRLTEEIYGELVAQKSTSHTAVNDSDCSVEEQCGAGRIPVEDSVKQEL